MIKQFIAIYIYNDVQWFLKHYTVTIEIQHW